MTDFRTLTQPHDLRSQLGLIPGRRAEELSSQLEAALRVEDKPLSPDCATPDPLHSARGCTSNQVINVTINPNDPVSKDAAEIVASTRKRMDRPDVQHLRSISALQTGIDVLNAAERFHG